MILLIGAAALAGLYFMTQKKSVTSEGESVDESSTSTPEVIKIKKVLLYDLQDVDTDDQGGNYKRDYDIYFESASEEF